MSPVGHANTRISIGYAQKSPRSLESPSNQNSYEGFNLQHYSYFILSCPVSPLPSCLPAGLTSPATWTEALPKLSYSM